MIWIKIEILYNSAKIALSKQPIHNKSSLRVSLCFPKHPNLETEQLRFERSGVNPIVAIQLPNNPQRWCLVLWLCNLGFNTWTHLQHLRWCFVEKNGFRNSGMRISCRYCFLDGNRYMSDATPKLVYVFSWWFQGLVKSYLGNSSIT